MNVLVNVNVPEHLDVFVPGTFTFKCTSTFTWKSRRFCLASLGESAETSNYKAFYRIVEIYLLVDGRFEPAPRLFGYNFCCISGCSLPAPRGAPS